jgi:hypothetical protein
MAKNLFLWLTAFNIEKNTMDYKDFILHHEIKRKEMWLNVWAAVASSSNCISTETCTKWADKALREFDNRFPKPFIEAKAATPPEKE